MAAEMAQKPQISEAMFREAIRFSLGKLGQPELELKQEQLEAIKAICVDKKDVLAVLRTGFGKSLIYQILPAVFDFLRDRKGGLHTSKQKPGSVVVVVSPFSAILSY